MRPGRSYRERVKNRDSGETFRENLGLGLLVPGLSGSTSELSGRAQEGEDVFTAEGGGAPLGPRDLDHVVKGQ